MMAVAEPPITSVRTFRYEMGKRSVEMLVAAIAGARDSAGAFVDLGFEIRKRRNTP